MKRNKKGQLVVYDFIFGFLVFIFIVVLVSITWYKANARVGLEVEQEIKLKIAHDAMNQLVHTPGYPDDWEFAYVTDCGSNNCTLGLAHDHNLVSAGKLDAFVAIADDSVAQYSGINGTERIRELLKLGRYDFYFKVRDKDGTVLSASGYDPKANLSVTITRKVLVDGNLRSLEFTVH